MQHFTGLVAVMLAVLAPVGAHAAALTPTAFTYQGHLKLDGVPANGIFDFRFTLSAPGMVLNPIPRFCAVSVPVENGLFTVDVEFPEQLFDGRALEVTVAVQPHAQVVDCSSNTLPDPFTSLGPPQPITPTPYALFALNAPSPHALDAADGAPIDALIVDDAGRVGIGTLTPTEELTVAGDVALSISGQYKGINGALGFLDTLATFSGPQPGVKLESITDIELHIDTDNNSTSLPNSVRIYGNGETRSSDSPILLISDEGNVNIGGTSFAPNRRLEVGGTSHPFFNPGDPITEIEIFHYLEDDVAPAGFNGATAGLAFDVLIDFPDVSNRKRTEAFLRAEANDDGSQLFRLMIDSANTDMTFDMPAGEAMRITSGRRVGIGTASPTNPLHVLAAGTATGGVPGFNEVAALFRSTVPGHTAISVDSASNQDPVLYLAENGSARWGIRNDAGAGDDFQIRQHTGGANTLRLSIEALGNVGIGTGAHSVDGRLHVESLNARAAKFDRFGSDGELVAFARDDGVVGNITVSSGVVSYNAFTGSHYAWSPEPFARGALVSMTGENRRLTPATAKEVVYGVKLADRANDPACLGAFLDSLPAAALESPFDVRLISADGNGELCVVNAGGGDIEPGDYLISASVAGCAMKDDPARFPVGHVIARAAERVRWADVPAGKDGVQRVQASVLFGSFVRGGDVAALARELAEQRKELNELRQLLRESRDALLVPPAPVQ